MVFTNAGISLEEIPSAVSVEWQPVEPGLRKVKLLSWLMLWLVVFIGWVVLTILVDEFHTSGVLIGVSSGLLLLSIFHLITQLKSVQYKAYAIRDHDLLYRTGWIIRSVRTCPFNRVQHCSVSSGILSRKFGVSTLRLYTAGGNDADVRIQGLKPEIANNLREWIVDKIHRDGGNV